MDGPGMMGTVRDESGPPNGGVPLVWRCFMVSVDQARQLLGVQVVDAAGDKVGPVKKNKFKVVKPKP